MNAPDQTFHLKIYAPFKIYYDGPVNSFSASNETGPFDILAHHKNFMSLLVPCTITARKDKSEPFSMSVSRGVLHAKADEVKVFLDV